MQNYSENQSPLDIGEHFLTNLVIAMIAERHPAESPIRKGLEACVEKELPIVFQEGNSSGDIIGALKRWVARLEMILSQMEAERGLEERATGITAPQKAIEKAAATGDLRSALEEWVFFLLRWERWHNFAHPDIQHLIHLAAINGDIRFFKRLGRALEKRAKKGYEDLEVDKLQFALVKWWLKGPNGELGLCWLTDEAVLDYFKLAFGRHILTLDWVRKTRQRLGLVKGRKPWFTKVTKTEKGIIASFG